MYEHHHFTMIGGDKSSTDNNLSTRKLPIGVTDTALPVLSKTCVSAPARPMLAPLSMREPYCDEECLETRYIDVILME